MTKNANDSSKPASATLRSHYWLNHFRNHRNRIPNIDWNRKPNLTLGKELPAEQIKASLSETPRVGEAFDRMMAHFEANGIGTTNPGLGAPLTTNRKTFTGEFAAAARKLDREHYRDGHTLPNA